MSDTSVLPTEIQWHEIKRGDLIRVSSKLGDATVTREGRAHRMKGGIWETEDGITVVTPAVHPRAVSQTIELLERPATEGLPQEPGTVIIATLINGVEGYFPLFRGRAAWHSGTEIANGWMFADSEIQAWRQATIVEEVIQPTSDTNGAEL